MTTYIQRIKQLERKATKIYLNEVADWESIMLCLNKKEKKEYDKLMKYVFGR